MNNSFAYKGQEYFIGQKVNFLYDPGCREDWQECSGEVCFQEYDDDEQYSTINHLGVVIKFDYVYFGKTYTALETFPDFVNDTELSRKDIVFVE